MAQLTERGQLLSELCISEKQLAQWKRAGYEEAIWRNDHELKMNLKWAKERHAFIKKELDAMNPPKIKPRLPPNTPPIQSHRNGQARSGGTLSSIHGEKFG